MEFFGVLAAATLLAGMLKGVVGFGGALLLAPVFTLTMGPRSSALLIVGIHAITAGQGIRESKQWIRWKAVGASCFAAIVAAAVIAPWVIHASPGLLKSVSAISVILLAALHLSGWRMVNRGGWAPSMLVGVVSGALTAACGLGGPPAALLFAGQSREKDFLRGNLMAYFMLLYTATMLIFVAHHQFPLKTFLLSLGLAPIFWGGSMLGQRLATRLPIHWFDRVVGLTLLVLGAVLLVE